MKIVMLGHKRIPSREGGVEVVVEQLCTRMVQLGHQVTCLNRKGHNVAGKEYDHSKLKEYQGIQIKEVLTIDLKGLSAMTSSFFACLKAGSGDYDIVHIHAEGPAFFAFIPKWCGKKVIVTIHGLDWQRAKWGRFASWYIKKGERNAVKYADEIIVLSNGNKAYFKSTYNRDTVYIPNGIHKPEIKNTDSIHAYNLEKDQYILFLGRIVPEKGIHYLIEAFKKLDTDLKLVIAGGISDSGDYSKEIQTMAKDDSRIIFTGFVQGKELAELYSNAYIYCLPSDVEGMPLSLLEAMSYGNCTLTSDISECKEVIENHGITFKKGNIADLKNQLEYLINHPEIVNQYKKEASDFICQKYNWDEVVEKTMELYQ